MFEKIWQRVPIKAAEQAEADRRIWDRLPSERQTIVLADDGEHLSARVQNVSRGGVRMLINREVEAGAMVSIALPAGEGEAHSTILACVVHIDAAGDGVWSMGCSFATELSDAEIQTLGASRVRAPEDDQRAWGRVAVTARANYQQVGAETSVKRSADIHNISPAGVALRLSERIEPGVLLSMELRSKADAPVLTIVGCIVHISEEGPGEWLVGCNFVRELNDEELRKLT